MRGLPGLVAPQVSLAAKWRFRYNSTNVSVTDKANILKGSDTPDYPAIGLYPTVGILRKTTFRRLLSAFVFR
jgi:hypothetical protein